MIKQSLLQPSSQIKNVNGKTGQGFELQKKRWLRELTLVINTSLMTYLTNLQQEFQSYEKKDLSIVLEYCEYDLKTAQSFLRTTSKAIVRKTIQSFCFGPVKTVNEGESMMKLLNSEHKSIIDVMKISNNLTQMEEIKIPECDQSTELVQQGFPLFENITSGLLYLIFDYLDPVSLARAGSTCKLAHRIYQLPLLYKKFCLQLYSYPPRLPEESAFKESLNAINHGSFGEFSREFVQQANQNFRSFVWLPDVKSYYIGRNYFKKYKDFRSVYFNAPRLSFIGYYVMKGKYLRDGERDPNSQYAPFHLVEYYRYFRFYPDGSVSHCLSVKKLKQEFVEKLFCFKKENLEEMSANILSKNGIKDRLMRGEYITQGEKLHVRLCAGKVLYEYKLSFQVEGPAQFVLKLDEYGLRYIEQENVKKLPLDAQGSKQFKFVHVPHFEDEIEESPLKYMTL